MHIQRIRTQVNFITSEYLQGVLMFEIGSLDWGRNANGKNGQGSGDGLDADGVNIETKRAYPDWIIPDTEISVHMGTQGLKMPSTPMGSPVFDADVAGVLISSPVTDWLSASMFWIRPFNAYLNDDNANSWDNNFDDEVDVFGLLLPMKFDGWSVTPWGMYGFIGANSAFYGYMFLGSYTNMVGLRNKTDGLKGAENSHTKCWWLGTHLEMTALDPLVFNLGAIYRRLSRANVNGLGTTASQFGVGEGYWDGSTNIGMSGWFIGTTLDYKLDCGTPGIFGWWGSGDDKRAYKDGMLGRLPTFGNDGGSFSATSFGMNGCYSIGNGGDTNLVTGTWGVGIQFADFSFIEDLSHTLRFAYYRGTNDAELIKSGAFYMKNSADGLYLTDEDSVLKSTSTTNIKNLSVNN